jgi:hypothetical protein
MMNSLMRQLLTNTTTQNDSVRVRNINLIATAAISSLIPAVTVDDLQTIMTTVRLSALRVPRQVSQEATSQS